MTRKVNVIIIFVFLIKLTSCLGPKDLLLRNIFLKNPTDVLELRNTTCANDLLRFYRGLYASERWAVMMMDASSSLPSGIFTETLVDFGAYDHCMNLKQEFERDDVILGQYCMGQVSVLDLDMTGYTILMEYAKLVFQGKEPTDADFRHFTLAYCVPNSCSNNELQDIFNTLLNTTALRVPHDMCQTVETIHEPLGFNWIVVTFFILLGLAVLSSTIYDLYIQNKQIPPKYRGYVAFSLYTNAKVIFTPTEKPDHIRCLYGMRVLSIFWLILGHVYQPYNLQMINNSLTLWHWFGYVMNYYTISSTLAIDTLLALSGMLASYTYFLARAKNGMNLFFIIRFKHIRMSLTLTITVMVAATLLPYFGSGPLWNKAVVEPLHIPCQENWRISIAFLQNYINLDNSCLPFTWYLAVDMQLYLLSPLLLIPLFRWPKYTIWVIFVTIIMGVVSPYLAAPATTVSNMPVNDTSLLNVSTHTRFGPWVIGFLSGYLIFRAKNFSANSIVMKYMRLWNAIGWVSSACLIFASLFAGYDTMDNFITGQSALFMAFRKTMWSLGISFIIFACSAGYGGPLNWFLSLSFFQMLGKISFPMFLLYHLVQAVIIGQIRAVEHFSIFTAFSSYFTIMCFILVFSVIASLFVEYPFVTLERIGGAPDSDGNQRALKLYRQLRQRWKQRKLRRENAITEV